MMEKEICPFCGRRISDLLRHFVIDHDIDNMDNLSEEFIKAEMENKKRNEFSKYINELKEKRRKSEITAADFRELTVKWWRDHN